MANCTETPSQPQNTGRANAIGTRGSFCSEAETTDQLPAKSKDPGNPIAPGSPECTN